MKKLITLLFILVSLQSNSQVVISQVYGGGGNAGSTYMNDYIELFNRGTAAVSLNGWSVQYNSATSTTTTWQVTNLPNFTLQPGQYFLVQEALGAGGTTPLPTPDATGTIALSATAGKVALVNNTTAFAIQCPAGLIDFVGFGTTANCFEGTGPTPAPSNTTAVLRLANGCTDNNQNATDFVAGAPLPRNTATTLNPCSGGTPALSATILSAFGPICIGTTTGPNNFTLTGTALTGTVTINALPSFTYSTSSGGTYTSTLILTPASGAINQVVYVKFSPVLVQSYNGNILISGGGATSINVAASGSGVNAAPTVTTGGASAITTTTATCAGTIPATGCSALTAYGIQYSTVSNPTGGTSVPSSNLSGINFSSNLIGLIPNTIYFYHAYATNGGGTVYGAELTFTTSITPALSATALNSFPATCIGTTSAANSFTVTGSNLTSAVTVGALSVFTYATSVGGTYFTTLTLTPVAGAINQIIFVKFSPLTVQTYSGNILISGGGASNVNVAVTGAGVNSAPTVNSGGASAITQTTVTLAGTIPSNGCSAITAYGVEYSITNNFPNGSGTAVASGNLSGSNFSSGLTGLLPSTVYYYHAYATNGGGTAYGSQQSFTTAAPVLTATAITGFGAICINTTAGPNSFTINSNALTPANVNVGPLAGYTFSTTSGGVYAASLSLIQPGSIPYSQIIYVKFMPVTAQAYNGNIPVNGGGATLAINVAVTGSGVNTTATVVTGNATVLSPNNAVTTGSITNIGCSAVTSYGIEFSGINGFANGTGKQVRSNNLTGTGFTASLNGLVQNTVYYYKAYAVNNGGTAYGAQQTFSTTHIPNGLVIYSVPLYRGGNVHFSLDGIMPGHYSVQLHNSVGQLVYQKEFIIQVNFLDQQFTLPAILGIGRYNFRVVNPEFLVEKSIMIK